MPQPVYGSLRQLTPQEELDQIRLLNAIDDGRVVAPNVDREGATSPAQTAVSLAYADTEADPRTNNPGYAHIGADPVDSYVANTASLPFTRPVSDEEYDDQTRRHNLVRRLQDAAQRYPVQYGDTADISGVPMGMYPQLPSKAPTPSPRTAVNAFTYPGMPLAEGLSWWDTTLSLPVNAIRMTYGASDAPQKFSEAADTFLLGLPTFARHGTFHPERDRYENEVRRQSSGWYKTPWSMYGVTPQDAVQRQQALAGLSDDGSVVKRDGQTGTLQVMQDFGIPETDGTRIGSYMLDALIDPDSGSIDAIRHLIRGVPSAAARGLASDNGVMLGLEGIDWYNQHKVQ